MNTVEDDLQCSICHLPLKEPVLTRCGHRFCKECVEEHFRRLVEKISVGITEFSSCLMFMIYGQIALILNVNVSLSRCKQKNPYKHRVMQEQSACCDLNVHHDCIVCIQLILPQ